MKIDVKFTKHDHIVRTRSIARSFNGVIALIVKVVKFGRRGHRQNIS